MNHNRQELVLITGASGAVGPRVVDALCSAGHQVRSFSLDALPGAFPSGVQAFVGDITNAGCGHQPALELNHACPPMEGNIRKR